MLYIFFQSMNFKNSFPDPYSFPKPLYWKTTARIVVSTADQIWALFGDARRLAKVFL